MDARIALGLGISAFFAFLRYRFPVMPKSVSNIGIAAGILWIAYAVWLFLVPPVSPNPAVAVQPSPAMNQNVAQKPSEPAQAPARQPEKPEEKLSPEDIATKLSIWESVSTSNLALMINAYNLMDAGFARWPRMIDSADSRRQLYQDITNSTAAFAKAVGDLETLRSEYPEYKDVSEVLVIQPYMANLAKASSDFSNAISRQ
jgi:hypothetical protein